MRHFAVIALLACVPIVLVLPAFGQNILNNGGFEHGAMCFGYWDWSSTGVDFAGDYKFSLSTDAHSGSYAAQISCGGSDCNRAAFYTSEIPITTGKQYTIGVWAKCSSGATASSYTDSGGNNVSMSLTCDGTWHQNTMSYTAPNSTPLRIYFQIAGSAWLRFDDVTLTYSDGTAPSRTQLHAGTRSVSISGQTVKVDGSPFLSLGFFDVPDSAVAAAAATGANTVNGVGGSSAGSGPDCYNTAAKSFLDQLYEAGMTYVPDSSISARMQIPSVFPSIMTEFAPHLANIAWLVDDEPDLYIPNFTDVPAATYVSEVASAATATSLPLTTDFQHAAYDTATYVSPWTTGTNIWMAEPYGTDFTRLKHAVDLFNSIDTRPIWLAQDDIDASLIVPKAYWAIVNGVTGLHYFTWSTFLSQPAKLAAVEQVFSELTTLKNPIFGSAVDALVTPPTGVSTMSRYYNGTVYILAVNPTASAVSGKLAVGGLASGQQVNVLFEGRNLTAATAGFTDSFNAYSRHVYAITATSTSLTATLAGKSGSTSARDWKIQVTNTGLAAANNATISGLTLTRTGGTVCTPKVQSGLLPMTLGTLAPAASLSGDVMIDFTGCDSTSKFTVNIALSANSGATTATVTRNNERQ